MQTTESSDAICLDPLLSTVPFFAGRCSLATQLSGRCGMSHMRALRASWPTGWRLYPDSVWQLQARHAVHTEQTMQVPQLVGCCAPLVLFCRSPRNQCLEGLNKAVDLKRHSGQDQQLQSLKLWAMSRHWYWMLRQAKIWTSTWHNGWGVLLTTGKLGGGLKSTGFRILDTWNSACALVHLSITMVMQAQQSDLFRWRNT